jgi:hypothetical protein
MENERIKDPNLFIGFYWKSKGIPRLETRWIHVDKIRSLVFVFGREANCGGGLATGRLAAPTARAGSGGEALTARHHGI